MHSTLNPRNNFLMIILWGTCAVILFVFFNTRPFLIMLIVSIFGIIIGMLQSKSITKAANEFLSAKSAIEVRRAMVMTNIGKQAVRLQWVVAILLLIISFLQKNNPIMTAIMGYLSLMFFCDVTTFKSTLWLSRLEVNNKKIS